MNHEEKSQRRRFLKRAVYHTPVLYVLGRLSAPSSLRADFSGGPPGPPGGTSSSARSTRKSARKPARRKRLRF